MAMLETPKRKSHQDVDSIKVPPYSIEAEQSVLGSLLLDNNAWDTVADRVNDIDFYRQEHKTLFNVIQNLATQSKPFDIVTVCSALRDLGELENAGGELYLFELSRNTPSAANIKAYADIVRERSVLRQLISTANQIADSGYHPEGMSSNDILDLAEQKIFQIAERGNQKGGPQNINLLVAQALERIDSLFMSDTPVTGIPSGFVDLDKLTSGLHAGDLVIVAGRPSMGKTMFGMNIGEYAAITARKPVLVFSLEMPGDAIAMRMLSSLGGVPQQNIRTGKLTDQDWPRLASAISLISEAPMFIDDSAGLTPLEVRARARRLAREQGQLGLIIVDYLQLMRGGGHVESRVQEISEISRSLKALAKELNVPVIALSQLNRSLEQRADRRPVMSDLRESGAIEQDADLILFIYRESVYNPQYPNKRETEILVAKHRNGPTGRFKLCCMGEYTRFENYANMDTLMLSSE